MRRYNALLRPSAAHASNHVWVASLDCVGSEHRPPTAASERKLNTTCSCDRYRANFKDVADDVVILLGAPPRDRQAANVIPSP